MAHEIGLCYQWLVSTLTDTTLQGYAPGGVRRGMAKTGTSTPFVIVAYQAGSDNTTMNAVRVMDNLLFQVRASGPASSTTAIVNAASRIDALIDGQRNQAITGGVVLCCYRDSPLQYDELVSGELWSNFGGLYRIEIQQA